ncbi:hypothetical protein [Mycolicibacterium farcinogenes]|uniref:Uncharacterized protein n=1 Tax=Mycolicibacterium farcinogenes TaxID=1802 RepID=A0ACD1FHB5_MYCFR|nr:hypothetical protein [Mycolicibacterium farcinogenes]QZH66452.1 hypothetical protein K6L26_01690 [Mycolicibacterium farcinogenes]
MNVLESSLSVLGLVSGSIGAWYGYRAYRHSKAAPFDERQAELRADLRRWINKQHRLVRAVNTLDRGLPGDAVRADLDEFRYYLSGRAHRFDVPRPAHIETVIKSIDDALVKLAVAHHVPRNDSAFIPHVDLIKANVLRPWLVRAQDNINVLLNGLAEIERQPMSRRKQLKLFRALEPKNQTPVEE